MKMAVPNGYIQSPVNVTDGLPVKVGPKTYTVARGSQTHHNNDSAHPVAHVIEPTGKIRKFTPQGEVAMSRSDQAAVKRKHFAHVTIDPESR